MRFRVSRMSNYPLDDSWGGPPLPPLLQSAPVTDETEGRVYAVDVEIETLDDLIALCKQLDSSVEFSPADEPDDYGWLTLLDTYIE